MCVYTLYYPLLHPHPTKPGGNGVACGPLHLLLRRLRGGKSYHQVKINISSSDAPFLPSRNVLSLGAVIALVKTSGMKGGVPCKGGVVAGVYKELRRKHKKLFEHRLIAVKVLGRTLPKGVEVHHINEDKGDNRNENLVICQDHAYHSLLHVRTRAYRETGDANKRRCKYCKQWGVRFELVDNDPTFYHKRCHADYEFARKRRVKQ